MALLSLLEYPYFKEAGFLTLRRIYN